MKSADDIVTQTMPIATANVGRVPSSSPEHKIQFRPTLATPEKIQFRADRNAGLTPVAREPGLSKQTVKADRALEEQEGRIQFRNQDLSLTPNDNMAKSDIEQAKAAAANDEKTQEIIVFRRQGYPEPVYRPKSPWLAA